MLAQHQQRPQPMSAAARNAEALFEAKNVTEIRQIEARTRKDIAEKNLQLRQLVGDSYRDLIEGTDKIIDISTKCHNILGNILAIQEGFSGLAVSVTCSSGSGQDGKESARKHQELHAVGSRVKYIMDTPEIIWGCLDSQQHLEAARRLMRSHEVHQQLQTAFSAEVAGKFPLLSHQWPLVLKFRQHILDGATSALSGAPDLSSQQAVDAVAAVALLEGLSSAAALQQFLAGRKQWAAQQLELALQTPGEQLQEQPGRVLAALAQQVQSCIAQVGELFTSTPPSSKAVSATAAAAAAAAAAGQPGLSLLQQSLQEDEADASELYFGSVDGSAEGSNSPEALAWRQNCASIIQQLSPLQRSQVEAACSAWLTDIAASCAEHGLTLLQLCDAADSLLEAELAVCTAIADWQLAPAATSPAAPASTDDVQATSDQAGAAVAAAGSGVKLARSGSSAAALLGGAGAGLRGAVARGPSDWERTCSAVLGQRLDLWQVLFHGPFLERCKQLIQAGLEAACSCINDPLAAALAAAARHEPEAAGHLHPGSWPLMLTPPALGDVALDRTYSFVRSGRTSSGAWNVARAPSLTLLSSGSLGTALSGQLAGLDDAAGFRNEVYTIRALFDRRLHAVLQAVLLLMAAAPEQAAAAQNGKLVSSNSSVAGLTAAARTSSLARTSSTALQTPAAGQSSAAAAACLAAGKQRAAHLEQFTQQQCLQRMQQLAQQLQQQMSQLPAVQGGLAGASAVEQVLLIARLCYVLGANSIMLPALLGSPEAWQAACKAGPQAAAAGSAASSSSLSALLAQGVGSLGPAAAALLRLHHPGLSGQLSSSAASPAAVAQLAALQDQLRGIANVGHARWAAWVARSLTGGLLAALRADELLHSSLTPRSWLEVRLQADGLDYGSAGLLDPLGEAPAAGEMSFALPGCPSAALLQMLSLACWETRRAGEHLISPDALQLLEWELHGTALQAIQALAATSSSNGNGSSTMAAAAGDPAAADSAPGISEKGVLQLLFDQRLLRDVLGGAQPVAAAAAAAAVNGHGGAAAGSSVCGLVEGAAVPGAAAARKQLLATVENVLQEQLDPIDWATYEPHLWANVQRYYGRTAVLLGTLGQLTRPYSGAAAAKAGPSAASDINSLNMLPVAPRFHYLPISTPSAALHGAAAKQRLTLPAGAAVLGVGGTGGAAAAGAGGAGAAGALGLASVNNAAADLAAQYIIAELGSAGAGRSARAGPFKQPDGAGAAAASAAVSFGASLHMSADSAAAAGASALSALQARLQGSSIGAFGSLLGAQAAEVTAGLGDFLPSAGLGGGLLSSFARREGQPSGTGTRK